MPDFKILTLAAWVSALVPCQNVHAEFPKNRSCGEYQVSGTVECIKKGFCGIIGSMGTYSEFRMKFASNEAWHDAFNHAHIDAVVEVTGSDEPVTIRVSSFKRSAPVFEKGDERTLLRVKKCHT